MVHRDRAPTRPSELDREPALGALGAPTHLTQLGRSGVHPTVMQEPARHSDIKTTMSYVHVSYADRGLAVQSLPPMIGQAAGHALRASRMTANYGCSRRHMPMLGHAGKVRTDGENAVAVTNGGMIQKPRKSLEKRPHRDTCGKKKKG